MKCGLFTICLFVAAQVGTVAVSADNAKGPKAPAPSFSADIKPLFEAKCSRCHGDKARKGDLDLRTPAAIMKGGESGAVIVPGKSDQSLLYQKVHGGMMPPAKKDRLNEVEVDLIRR